MKFLKLFFSKKLIIALSIILQFLFFLGLVVVFNEHYIIVSILTSIVAGLVFLAIINQSTDAEYKIPLICLVFAFPILGVAVYVLFINNRLSSALVKKYVDQEKQKLTCLKRLSGNSKKLNDALGENKGQSDSIKTQSLYPAHVNSNASFLNAGESFYKSLLIDLKNAKKYIFLEYFIIEEGEMWSGILEILKQKVKQGVDVRVLYDDIGCATTLKSNYYKTLQKEGIKCYKFNKFNPIISPFHNNRDHRKIAVIDGIIGYTGGINIADEYINVKRKYGYWKDTAVRIKGEAVANLTILFLQNYNATTNKSEDYSTYIKDSQSKEIKIDCNGGAIQPFGDAPKPLDNDNISENAILNMIYNAKTYVYISTPYIICSHAIIKALTLASNRGVDVRIVVPNIPDKKLIYLMTLDSCLSLCKSGVKIYKYTPGFIHSKVFVSDNSSAIVGTINLDYRSLVHHFEDGVYIVNSPCVKEIVEDFTEIFKVSKLQTDKTLKNGVITKFICSILKLFSPLL